MPAERHAGQAAGRPSCLLAQPPASTAAYGPSCLPVRLPSGQLPSGQLPACLASCWFYRMPALMSLGLPLCPPLGQHDILSRKRKKCGLPHRCRSAPASPPDAGVPARIYSIVFGAIRHELVERHSSYPKHRHCHSLEVSWQLFSDSLTARKGVKRAQRVAICLSFLSSLYCQNYTGTQQTT